MNAATNTIPKAFIWRRVHSLMGLWLVVFLIEHLLTNSQAALWLGDNGRGFVNMVNALHNLPYLEVIEVGLLGIPLLIHMFWGVQYLLTGKINTGKSDGTTPHLPLRRNRAYSLQRITSWILLIGIICHVAKFRFLDYPTKVVAGEEVCYFIPISMDDGLYTLSKRLDVTLYDAASIAKEKMDFELRSSESVLVGAANQITEEKTDLWSGPLPQAYSAQKERVLGGAQKYQNQEIFVHALDRVKLSKGNVLACAKDFGTATLLAVRNTFKSPIYMGLYTIFVLAACFHACNGFWTFLLTWGWVLKMSAQRAWTTVVAVMMVGLVFLGLAAIWGTYWINLRY